MAPLSYLTILFLIKLRGISRITTAEIINRCIRSKSKIYMGIVIYSTIEILQKIGSATGPPTSTVSSWCNG